MRHDLQLGGYAFSLRPVTLEDAGFIVQVRANDPQRTRYLHPIAPDVEQQRAWLNRYFDQPDDYYWLVERTQLKAKEGLLGIYNVDENRQTAEWGRWVLRPGSLAAAESAMLVYRSAFELLKLESLYCVTVTENHPVVSFHDSCGLVREALLPAHFRLGDRVYDGVKHICTRQNWPTVCERLKSHAHAVARRLSSPS